MKSIFPVFLSVFLTVVLFSACSFNQSVIEPELDWPDTEVLHQGNTSYEIRYMRTGWETQQFGEMEQTVATMGDSLLLYRKIGRGENISFDTVVMSYPGLSPISYWAQKKDTYTQYEIVDGEIHTTIEYHGVDTSHFSRKIEQPFFDISSLALVLGAINHRNLKGTSTLFFDPESANFTELKITEFDRENIASTSGKEYRCNVFKGKLNQANVTYWMDRSSGKLIKSRTELSNSMILELLLKG